MFQVFMMSNGGPHRVTEDFGVAGRRTRRQTTQRLDRHLGLRRAASHEIVTMTPLRVNLPLHVHDTNHNFLKMESTFQFLRTIPRSCWHGLPRMRASTLGPRRKSFVSET